MKNFTKGHLLIMGIIVLFWVVLEFLFYDIALEAQKEYEKNLVKQAEFYNKDIQNISNWNFKVGGLYAFKNALKADSNQYEELLETKKGSLVRINPGWMTRLLSDNFKEDMLHYSIVSNNPINPLNKATGYYAKKLKEIEENNSKEPAYQIDKFNKRLYYMQPLYTTKKCMACHSEKMYKLDSLRGAIVVDIDASFILDRTTKLWYNFYFVSALATLLVVIVLFFVKNLSKQKLDYLRQNLILEKKLHEKVVKLNQVLRASGIGYWEWNYQTGEHTVDDQWLKILGLSRSSLVYKASDWIDRVDPDDLKKIMPVIENAIKNKATYTVEFRMRHADGHYVWVQGSGGVTALDTEGRVLKLSGTHQDISKRKILELDQNRNTGYLNTLFEKNPNIIIVTNGKKIIKANDAFFRFFHEYDSLEAFLQEHSCICDFFEPSDDDNFISCETGIWIEEAVESLEPIVKLVYKKREYYFAVHARKIYENDTLNTLVTLNNITETYGLKKRFEELSIIDELTKVYNRRYFNKVFKEEINRATREHHSFCFVIMDIDNFKLYNDNYGHDDGDKVLVSFADAVRGITKRSNEFLFRLGGEEFGVIFNPTSKEEALAYAQKICKSVEALNIEHLENLPWKKFTVSIGLVYIEAGEDISLKEIYKHADQALYLAKERGRNRVEIFGASQ